MLDCLSTPALGSTRDQTQGFVLAQQTLYHPFHNPSPKLRLLHAVLAARVTRKYSDVGGVPSVYEWCQPEMQRQGTAFHNTVEELSKI